MSAILERLRGNLAYAFIGVGVVWLAIALVIGSYLTLWPVVTCFVSGFLLRSRGGDRLTWAWVSSSAVLGLLLSSYQVYAWVPFIGGSFSTSASVVIAGFGVFAVAHLLLLYLEFSAPKQPI